MKWIPIEYKLPDIGQDVLVTIKLEYGYHWIMVARYGRPMLPKLKNKVCFYGVDPEWGDAEVRGVIAWMPLPKPYESNKEVHSDA